MMAERHPQEDEAALYVLGQLSPAAEREFETQLAQSAALRALVQELEEGVETLARAVPPRPLPPQTWAPIEQAIAQEVRQKIVTPALWSNWWRNGWAAAAACLLGWLSYALWSPRNEVQTEAPALEFAVNVPGAFPPTPVESIPIKPLPKSTPGSLATTAMTNANRELGSLRWQVATLQTQVQHLAQVLNRQQEIMAEPGRFKFFPQTDLNSGSTTSAPMSAGLQRAMFHAMAQELGWLPPPTPAEAQNNLRTTITTNQAGVDFVYLPASAPKPSAALASQSQEEESFNSAGAPTVATSVQPSGNIPGVLSATNLFLGFDATVVRNGSPVEFWINHLGDQGPLFLGSTVTSENPMVVTVPLSAVAGGELTVTTPSGFGASNVIGHYIFLYAPSLPQPLQQP